MPRLVLCSLLLALTAGAVAQTSQTLQTGSTAQNMMAEPIISSNGPVVAGFGNKIPQTGNPAEMQIAKEVRHELLMLPYYSLFDDLEFSVQGRTVTLSGSVTSIHSATKQEAEAAVKHIEGVDKVINSITVDPPAPYDQQIREQVYRKLNNAGGLSRYFWQAAPSIHIIVRNSNVTLKGYVSSEGDKDLAGITVKEIPNVFDVKNELQVIK
ncbi:MAG TPA: BON domain-containing protein [Verrucomicrobiae bacterium]|jgi:hyperosmotically inducible protein|nr:BON domain-containing protein [Verrucomicrobiae bacterium]